MTTNPIHRNQCRTALACAAGATLLLAATPPAQAQSNIKPPQAQAWIDVAPYSGMGMPMGMGGGAVANPMAALGSLFGGGGGGAKNNFGNSQSGSAGRWVDVTLLSRNNPSLAEAQQAVPAGFLPSPLKLQAPKEVRGKVPDNDDTVLEPEFERPRGKLLLYWGCGTTVRAGQPKVLDMASASAADMAKFFVSRRATQRGTHSTPGRPLWPSPTDARMVPAGAALAGEHAFSGSGVPEGFRFQIPAAQDLMPPLDLKTRDAGGAVDLSWTAAPTARAYFAAGMAAGGNEEIGNGNELNLVHPPRPADPKAAWEPVWAAKIRVKSVANSMLGMPEMDGMDKSAEGKPTASPSSSPDPKDKKPGAFDILRGVLGR